MLRKSKSFQDYRVPSSSSDTSSSSSSSIASDTPLRRSVGGGGGGGGGGAGEDHSDGSDADRPKRPPRHQLRVPTPTSPAQSTGNFVGGVPVGGCGAPRSAPATPAPLQLDPQARHAKHDKHALKPLSSSTPSVRASAVGGTDAGPDAGAGAVALVGAGAGGAGEAKAPSKARQKKFLRHFPQVGPDERVLNYYSCALVGDILLQGHLYITKNYFAFYSNVFGYVTKLLIPTASVQRVSKEKMARIIPNAVGVCTRDDRHVFGSLLSRDSTYKLMTHVWKTARAPELAEPPPPQELRISEVEMDASEYSPEDESSSGGAERRATPPTKRCEPDTTILAAATGGGGAAAVFQPALLTAGPGALAAGAVGSASATRSSRGGLLHTVLLILAGLLALSALIMAHRLHEISSIEQEEIEQLSGTELYSEVARWRARLHGRAAGELHAFLNTNLMLLTKVRQSLETLSNVILTDMAHGGATGLNVDLPS